jgi:hypothetical protein
MTPGECFQIFLRALRGKELESRPLAIYKHPLMQYCSTASRRFLEENNLKYRPL